MRVERGIMVALGYGKFFRSDSIVGLQPIEADRGPGRRTLVHVQNVPEPLVASRSEHAILGDLTGLSRAESRTQEQVQLLRDILDAIAEINPTLRAILRDQAHWDLDQVEERARDLLDEDVTDAGAEPRHEMTR